MSLALFNAVLSSNHSKSSTRFALALMAYHACARCSRVYVGIQRLANELNINRRNTLALLRKLREEKLIEPTGETTPQGTVVYRLVGVSESTPDDPSRGVGIDTGGVSKACRFCREGVSQSTPNKQVFDRHEIDTGETPGLAHGEGPEADALGGSSLPEAEAVGESSLPQLGKAPYPELSRVDPKRKELTTATAPVAIAPREAKAETQSPFWCPACGVAIPKCPHRTRTLEEITASAVRRR